MLWNVVRIRRLIREIQPDIIHLHGLYILDNLFLIATAWKLPNMVVSTWGLDVVYGTPGREPWSRAFIRRFLLAQAKRITATSRFLAAETARYIPAHKHVYVIPFGVDLGRFCYHVREKECDDVVIGYMKNLVEGNGPECFIRAVSRIVRRYPNIRVTIAGAGYLMEELKQLTRELGLWERVDFLGHIPHQRVPDILSSMDIFVMPSVWPEAFGVCAVEAQATGLPVIATRVGGIPEVIQDGLTGILVEPRHVDQLTEAIAILIQNPQLRQKMGRAGRRWMEQHYDWAENARMMEDLYRDMLRSNGSERDCIA
jgi:glycosyltransferase involved in cell wall biosynthesis